jgi:hypothetical protein
MDMTPTDLAPPSARLPENPPPERPAGAGRPAGCAITEEILVRGARFTIPPGQGIIPAVHLIFAVLWVAAWTAAITVVVLVPNDHGPFFNFVVLAGALAGEALALRVLASACAARFGVETITLGPAEVVREIHMGPLRRRRRVAIGRARGFRVDAFPRSRSAGGRRWAAYLSLRVGGGATEGGNAGGRGRGGEIRLAEGARDEDKFWLADQLNRELRIRQRGD